MTDNKIVQQILAEQKAGSEENTPTPSKSKSIAEQIVEEQNQTAAWLKENATRATSNALAFDIARTHEKAEEAKAKVAQMVEGMALPKTVHPLEQFANERVRKHQEEMAKFHEESAKRSKENAEEWMREQLDAEDRARKEELDGTIGEWAKDYVANASQSLGGMVMPMLSKETEEELMRRKNAGGVISDKLKVDPLAKELRDYAKARTTYSMGKIIGVDYISFEDLPKKALAEGSKIADAYIAEHPDEVLRKEELANYFANEIYGAAHEQRMNNDDKYFRETFKAVTGEEYDTYLSKRVNEAKKQIKALRDEAETEAKETVYDNYSYTPSFSHGAGAIPQSATTSAMAYGSGSGAAKPYNDLLEEIEKWEKNDFGSGFSASFDLGSMLSLGLVDVANEKHLNDVLTRASKGEKLHGNDARLFELWKIQQELEGIRDVIYEPQGWMSSIGEGVGTTVNMMPEFALAMTGTGFIGNFSKMGTMAELKAAFDVGGKTLYKYGANVLRKGAYNYGLAKGRGLIAAPLMPTTYNTYLETLNSGYKFDEDGNLTYEPVDKTQAALGAWFSTANEISSEYLGVGIGAAVGWGGKKLGKWIADTKVGEFATGVGNKVRKYAPKLTPQAKVAMRTLGVQADPVTETLSEALGDIMTSYEQTWIGMDVDTSQYGTMDYWMTLAGVTLVYGGSMATLGAVKSYRDVKKAVKAREDILGGVTNRNLYNTLVASSTTDDVVLASSALADFDWEGNYGKAVDDMKADMERARAFRAADLNVKIMQGMTDESGRLERFQGALEKMRDIVYKGANGEISGNIVEAEMDGKPVYVINGREADNATGLYVVVDPETGKKTSVDKSKVVEKREYTIDEYIDEAYSKAFSLEEEKMRVAEVKAKALQLDNPTEKDVARVASTLGITLPKVGNTVMLANGNMGAVTEVLSPTEYAVQDMTGATYKVHFTDILSTDKLTATAQGALARGEAARPIAPAPKVEAETTTETTAPDENGITIGAEVTVDGRVGKVHARTQDGKYAVAFEAESGNYEDTEMEFFTGEEFASLMGIAPMPTAEAPEVAETAPTEVATTEDNSVDIEQMSAEDAAKALIQRAGTIEEAIAQVKQVIETVAEERKKAAKADKKASLNDIGKKSAELQALDTRLEFFGEVLGVLEGMLAEQQKQTMTEAQNIAEEAGVAPEATDATDKTTEENKPVEQPTSGLIRNGAEMKFTDNVIRMVDFIAKRLGVTVEFVDDLKNEAGQPINGDIKGKHVRISTKGDRGVKFIVGHEFFHRIKDNVDEATYNKYIGALKEFFGEESWEAALIAQKRKYRAHNVAVAKKSMEVMTPEEVAVIAEQLGVNIEGLSAEDAKDAVARVAMRKAEQGDKVARALFPTMLTYSDDLMLEETAADKSGEMVANLDAFSNFVEDNKSEYAIIRGMHKALRYIHDMFASFGQTTRQRKVKRLVKNLENIMAEAVKNEQKGGKKPATPEDAKKKGVQGSDARFSLSSTPIFFSNAQYAVQNIKQEKATPEQWLKMIEKAGGLKAGEDKWLGLSDWLKTSDKKTLTKDEVLQYIAENDIQIEEVSYGDVADISREEIYESAEFAELRESLTEYDEDDNPYINRVRYDELRSESYDFVDGFSLDYWGEELEVDSPAAAATYLGLTKADKEINETRLGYTTQGLTNKREIALTVPTIESWNTNDDIHFGDAGEGRAVAWIRFGETTDADGKRVLVIDEIQSKRHQDGREKGYRDVEAEKREKAERERELTEVVLPRLAELNQLYNEKYGVGKWRDTEYDRQWRPRRVYRFLTPEEQAEHEAIAQRATELQMPMPRRSGIPSAPFEKNWAELAFKRMLRYAAENGYDYVAWTTGDQQAERYNIGNVIERVVSYPVGDNMEIWIHRRANERIHLVADNNGVILNSNSSLADAGTNVSEVLGKDLSQRIYGREGEDATIYAGRGKEYAAKEIAVDGLRIGGEGMKAFYDQMLPSFVKKYTKKWGAEVGEITMPALEENNTMHAVNVTDSMRESVMQGQPRFSLSEETTQIFDAAKAKFGTTYDMREAGYILPDGSMLDFSGRHQVEGDASFLNGDRTVDHRDIADIAYDAEDNETGIKTDLGDFLDRGAIRIDSNAGAINLNVAPTKAQKDRLKRLIERNDGYVYVDFGKGWDTEHYAEYEAARASRVLGDIDRYFDEGIKPTGNVRFSLQETNDRFNAELDAFKAGQNISELHLGIPSPLLRACGVSASEIFITAKTLRDHLKKHNLTEDEIKNLPIAINSPIMVYEWGEKAKSKIIITQIPRGEQRITVAIKMERGGKRLSVNELASVHGKDVERLMNEMLTTKSDFGKDNLKYVNKEIAMQWLGIAPPEGAASLTDAQQSIAKIIQDFQNPKIEARNSLITPEMDASYLSAVERGDMETAQKMVMEAAKLAMPNTKVVDEDGNPKVVYHGTPNEFTVFSYKNFGNTDLGNSGKAFYFSPEQTDLFGGEGKKNMRVFLDMQNPYISNWADESSDIVKGLSKASIYNRTKEELVDAIERTARGNNVPDSDVKSIVEAVESMPDEEVAEINSHDGVIATVRDGRIFEYAVSNPAQIKSADSVTYDDNGNVIPLSERFNPKKEDVRYSLIGEQGAEALDRAEKAKTRFDNLVVAREMEAAGKDVLTIKQATGWERGKDKKWRYEIMEGFAPNFEEMLKDEDATLISIEKLIPNSDILKAYPALKSYYVTTFDKPELSVGAVTNISNKIISLNIGKSEEVWRENFAHETQHLIQEEEFFERGANQRDTTGAFGELRRNIRRLGKELMALAEEGATEVSKAKIEEHINASHWNDMQYAHDILEWVKMQPNDMVSWEALDEEVEDVEGEYAWQMYRKSAGETEARAVGKRVNKNEAERRATLTTKNEDVAREDQVLLHTTMWPAENFAKRKGYSNSKKEDMRYALMQPTNEEDARFERKVAFLTDLVREYNIPLPTFIAQTKKEFKRMLLEYGVPEAEIDEDKAAGYYSEDDDIILINGGLMKKPSDISNVLLHENAHNISVKQMREKIARVAETLSPNNVNAMMTEFFDGGYKDLNEEEIVNEVVSYMVGYLQIDKTIPTFEGQISIEEFIDAWKEEIANSRYSNYVKEVFFAALPLVKENINYQKKQYGAERTNTIVIPRKEYAGSVEGGYVESSLQSDKESRPIEAFSRNAEADRRGEGADAQEVTRFMLPDPDPSDVFYDEIPIFDEQGNEVDITTLSSEEAKEILDGKVRQMLEAEYDHAVVAIRKEAEEARQAVKEVYRAEKEKRRKGAKAARTNAARIDEIFGDTPFESLPYEVQALILIATGEAKIYWGDKGNKRGLASELGLKGSTGDRHAYRNIWGGAKKSFDEVVHEWWESLGGHENGIDTQDLRNALISALQSVQSSKDAMQEIINKYDDLATDRDNALAEADRIEEKELREAKAAYEQHLANFELAEGDERTAYHDRATQFFGNQSLSRVEDILEDLTGEIERNKRKIERLKAENKNVYGTLAEGINKSKEVVLRALERLRMFAGMEEVDLNDVARLINLVKTARSQRQMNNLSAQATALVQRVSIKKAKTNLGRLLSLKLSNTDIIHKMLKESDKWTKGEREAILKHLWKVSRNGLRVSKAVHKDTKEIVDELKRLVDAFRKNELKGLNDEQKAKIIEAKLAEVEKELHPEVVYDDKGNVQDNANLPTDFNAENKHLAKFFFKSYLEMLAKEMEYHNASAELREKIDNKEKTDGANTAVVVARENYLNALNQFNSSLESLILEGKDKLRDWNAQKEQHEIEIRSMGIRAIGGKKASDQGKRSSKMDRARAKKNTTVNAPYWTFETVLEEIDHNSPYKKGKLYTYFMDKWTDANDDLINRYAAHMEEIAEVMRKCFPDDAKNILKLKRNPYALYQYIMRKAESTPIGTLTYKEKGESGKMRDAQIVLNVANAMYVIAMWRQPRYQEVMQEKHSITQSDIDALMKNIASVNAGFLDFMDWVNETFLPSTRLEYDVVYRKMNGGSMPKEINYFPARVAGHKEVDLANIDNGALPTTPSALEDRMSAHIMPQLGMDYFKVLESHIQDMDNWAAYAELTADLNVLLSSDEFRRRCNDYMGGLGGDGGGKGSLYDLFKQTSLIATGMYRGDAGMEALLGQLQKAWATSNIAFRGWTAVKQISSVTTGMFDNLRFYKHLVIAATGVGIYHEIKKAMEVSPSLRYRWKSGAAGMEALAREAQREDGYTVHRGAYEKGEDFVGDAIKTLVRAGMTPNAAVDLLACSIIVNSVYETEIARLTGGKREATEEEKRAAVRKAERAFNTTQQSSEGAYLAPVQANPAYGVLTTYMNASFALHRKRMGGIKELWKLATSKQYRRYLKDEFGVDAAKISAKDAFKDILSGVAGELSFAMMGWGLMKVMAAINGWLNDDDDDEDVAAAKQEFFDSWWQPLLNGYLGGSVVSSWINNFDTSLTPAYDEFAKDVKKLTDDKGSTMWEVAMMFTKYGIGIDLESWYKSAAAIENMYEDDERAGAVLMFLNAPDRYVKAFVGDRREGETLDEYTTRVGRTYALLEEIKFNEKGKPVGGGVYENFVPKSRYNGLDKVFEKEYREDMLKKFGGDKGYADYTMADLKHKQICGLLDWNPNATPSEEKVQTDMQDELEYYQKRVAKAVRERKNWVGSEEDYYDKLIDEQKAKDELINQYYEYIKQSGLGAY